MNWAPYFPAYAEPVDTEATPVAAQGITEQSETGANGGDQNGINRYTTKEDTIRRLTKDVEVADIGCGFGGLLVALAPKLPNTLLLGINHT